MAQGKGLIVRRPDAKWLLDIKQGLYEYSELITKAEAMLLQLDIDFENSTLPERVNVNRVREVFLKMLIKFYSLDILNI